MQGIGKLLIGTGIFLVLVGVVLFLTGNKLQWLGHLPGDIRIEKENFHFYFPITTMIIVSILLSIVVKIIEMLMRK